MRVVLNKQGQPVVLGATAPTLVLTVGEGYDVWLYYEGRSRVMAGFGWKSQALEAIRAMQEPGQVALVYEAGETHPLSDFPAPKGYITIAYSDGTSVETEYPTRAEAHEVFDEYARQQLAHLLGKRIIMVSLS